MTRSVAAWLLQLVLEAPVAQRVGDRLEHRHVAVADLRHAHLLDVELDAAERPLDHERLGRPERRQDPDAPVEPLIDASQASSDRSDVASIA